MTELAKVEAQAEETSVLQIISRASQSGNIEVAERMLAMQERILARNAELAFNEAMRSTQAELPKILRNKKNDQTSSRYADLERINDAIVPVYTRNGFSLSFGTDQSTLEGHIGITCIVSHVQGHSRPYRCDMPLDLVGLKGNANKTATHAHGSTMSYGRRYLTLLIFNVTLTNEDQDGNQGRFSAMTADQQTEIGDLLKELGSDASGFYRWISEACKMTIEHVDQIPANRYRDVKSKLESKKAAKR